MSPRSPKPGGTSVLLCEHAFDHAPDLVRTGQRRALSGALGVNAGLLVVGVIGGIVFGSLALLADAAHLVSDVAGLGIALGALVLTARRISSRHSFGFARAEVLAAQLSAVLLLAAGGWIPVATWTGFATRHPWPAGVRQGQPAAHQRHPVLVRARATAVTALVSDALEKSGPALAGHAPRAAGRGSHHRQRRCAPRSRGDTRADPCRLVRDPGIDVSRTWHIGARLWLFVSWQRGGSRRRPGGQRCR